MNVNAAPFNIETAFRTHYGRVARIIARVVRDHARAEELAVEVFLKLWRTRNAQADKVEAWLYRVAVRTALDELRGRTRRAHVENGGQFLVAKPVASQYEELCVSKLESVQNQANPFLHLGCAVDLPRRGWSRPCPD